MQLRVKIKISCSVCNSSSVVKESPKENKKRSHMTLIILDAIIMWMLDVATFTFRSWSAKNKIVTEICAQI